MEALSELLSWPEVHYLNNKPEGIKRSIEIALLQSIAGSLQQYVDNGGGGGTPVNLPADYINYPGPPTQNPPSLQNIVVDSQGRQWMFWDNEWQ